MGKVCKLWIHQSNFSEEDLVVNPKEFQNGLNEGDIIQIYQVFEDGSNTCKLLLQIKSLQTDFQQKETISLKHSVANKFKFRAYWDVQVEVIEPSGFTLFLVELKFKDQFLGQSDMWRFGKSLIDSAVYTSKKLSFAGARADVHEMWASCDEVKTENLKQNLCKNVKKVMCGVVGENTRVVFRSGSASVFIFIQMSKEMWDFDINGDLYFEKTVNGFFVELFKKWKEMKCTHSVSIIYFSRIFYDNNMLNNISDERRATLCCDYQGRLYEDFYRVITHEERRDDWSAVIVTLKKHFTQYHESLKKEDFPEGCLSAASEGNFLEVLNMGANVFEKAYIDRSFEVTGQQMVIITPGAGMFEVDRELATITKQRIVDNGISADLVCMAEQPLHSVPLLKFHGKFGSSSLIGDDYGIPHWINHSFYTSKAQENQRNSFVPRIKVPEIILRYQGVGNNKNPHTFLSKAHTDDVEQNELPDFVDYDAYDAEVFKCAQTKPRPQILTPGYNPYTRTQGTNGDGGGIEKFLKDENMIPFHDSSTVINRKQDNNDDYGRIARSLGIVKSFASIMSVDHDDVDGPRDLLSSYSPPLSSHRAVVGSADTSYVYQNVGRPQRSLVNPFRPNFLPCKMTCSRHRWRHAFPKGPGGGMLQEHHHKISDDVSAQADDDALLTSLEHHHKISDDVSAQADDDALLTSLVPSRKTEQDLNNQDLDETDFPHVEGDNEKRQPVTSSKHNRINMAGLGWVRKLHAPAEKDWTAAMKTSVDWKSLTIPACLPLTTDYKPDQRLLENHYKVYTYVLCLQADEDQSNKDEEIVVMKPEFKLKEFISQRLEQGFQLVCSSPLKERAVFSPASHSQSTWGVIPQGTPNEEYYFMKGRNFQKFTYTVSSEQMTFTRYQPTHDIKVPQIFYPYRLWSECTQEYVKLNTLFAHDDMSTYNWNYLDQYIVRDPDCRVLFESLNYWRVRLALLPLQKPASEKSLSGDAEVEENKVQFTYLQGILRFLETVNRIRRPPVTNSKTKKTPRKSRRPSAPAMQGSKSPAFVRTHRRSRSGGKDLETLNEDGVTSLDSCTSSSPIQDLNVSPRRRSSSSDNEDGLNTMPSLEEIVKEMRAKDTGLNFLAEMRGLPPKSFLGTDATSWIIHRIPSVKSRAEAVELSQKMLDEGFILHASGSVLQPFIDGFYLYYIVHSAERKSVKMKTPDEQNDELAYRIWKKKEDDVLWQFKKKWFEVVLKERGSESTNSSLGVFEEVEKDEDAHGKMSVRSDPVRIGSKKVDSSRDAEINLDADASGRPEWCTVRYHGIFCPDNAYVVHLRWLISTGAVVNQLVQSWARKVTLYGFHLVPVPSFHSDQPARSDPFTTAHYIPLDVTWLQDHISFQSISKKEFKTRVFLFQEAILKRFGFIKDFPYNEGIYSAYLENMNKTPKIDNCSTYRYIHYTGALFMTIVDEKDVQDSYGYRWILNCTLTKRWKSSVTLDTDAVRKLVKSLREFCKNREGKLAKYMESFF